MSLFEIWVLSGAVAMDATAVSLAKGPCVRRQEFYKLILLPFLFGVFQFFMPLLGGYLGEQIISYIQPYDAFVGACILGYLGISMVRTTLVETTTEDLTCDGMSHREMLLLALATSIDALAVGASLAFVQVNIWLMASAMGGITFFTSAVAIAVGRKVGDILHGKGELFGGIALLAIAFKMLWGAWQ